MEFHPLEKKLKDVLYFRQQKYDSSVNLVKLNLKSNANGNSQGRNI